MRWTRKRSSTDSPCGIAVRERLERLRAAIARLADRREEQRLLDPFGPVPLQVGARDEDRVLGGRACREIGGTREQVRRPVLQGAEQPVAFVEVDRAPLAPVLLGPVHPPLLRRSPVASGLPPDAAAAHRRRGADRAAREARDARRHQPAVEPATPAITTSTATDGSFAVRFEVLRHASLHHVADLRACSAPVERDVHLHRERAVLLGHADAAVATRSVDQLVHSLHLARCIRRIRGEHVVRDDRVTLHGAESRPGTAGRAP